MPKSSAIEAAIARLAALKLVPRSPEAKAELAKALAGKFNYLTEMAARFIVEHKLTDLADNLAAAFDFYSASRTDSGYTTRTEVARALVEIGGKTPQVYLAGVREGAAIGPPAERDDSAAALRAICMIGLARLGHRDALMEATDRLMDPASAARAAAARAMGLIGCREAAMVLRLKLHVGEEDAIVAGEMFSSLVMLDPERSLPMMIEYLHSPDLAIAESAALALGESRRPEALAALRQYFARTADAEARRPVLLAISLTRLPEATAFLVTQVASGDVKSAGYALEALRIYRLDDGLKQKIREAVEQRGSNALRSEFQKLF